MLRASLGGFSGVHVVLTACCIGVDVIRREGTNQITSRRVGDGKTKEWRGEGEEVKSVEGYHQTTGIERFGGLFCRYDENRVCGLTIQAHTQHLFLLDLLGTGIGELRRKRDKILYLVVDIHLHDIRVGLL